LVSLLYVSPPKPWISFSPPHTHFTLFFYFDLFSRIFFREFTSLRSILWIFLHLSFTSLFSNFSPPYFRTYQSRSSLNFGDQCSRQYNVMIVRN
jgi:hypothetical protein